MTAQFTHAYQTKTKLIRLTPLTARFMLVCMSGLAEPITEDCGDCPFSMVCFRVMGYLDRYIKGGETSGRQGFARITNPDECSLDGYKPEIGLGYLTETAAQLAAALE